MAFPYTNRPVLQRRPALVVALLQGGGMPRLLWVVMITSAAHRGWPGDVMVTDLATAGLPASSIIRTAKIATLDASDVERIGRLARADCVRVAASLRRILSSNDA